MRKSISVAMACYNGEKYIEQQLCSILKQLSEKDEIIISLDPSNDATKEIIESFNDARIHIISGPGKGVIKNFENAIAHTSNEVIFLSDQDDVWLDGKVDLANLICDDCSLVLHDAIIVDENLKEIEPSFFEYRKVKKGILNNIVRNSYIGCCMIFDSKLKQDILPFPVIPMHDQYIGLIAEKQKKVKWISKPYLLYRRHDSNVSQMHSSSISQQLKWRFQICKAIYK
ncbi:glycosyltransferase [Floccifex sp.]|uniref:glycosyltransferase n=1 Tax=Floccifex sp. TaxID=2815810 RepID=UPI002A76037D|nr:glycosyltransferase [Floccifex sp.]MDD7280535.1 glycosyltransferase [Erysipelotrichaceae bacterium]MDY2959165.1 glycosyltransferase [Floccifex sp.]